MPDTTARLVIASRWVAHGAIRYHYRVAGDDAPGIPLVLVHGLGVSAPTGGASSPCSPPAAASTRPICPGSAAPPARTTRSTSTPWRAPSASGWTRSTSPGRSTSSGTRWAGRLSPPSPAPIPRGCPGWSSWHRPSVPGVPGAPPDARPAARRALQFPSLLPVVLRDYLRAGPRRILRTDMLADDADTVAIAAQLATPRSSSGGAGMRSSRCGTRNACCGPRRARDTSR